MVRTREHLMLEYWVGIKPAKRPTSVLSILILAQERDTCEEEAECEKAEKVCQEHIGLVDVPATFLFVSCKISICISVIWLLYKIAKAKYQEIQMLSGILLKHNYLCMMRIVAFFRFSWSTYFPQLVSFIKLNVS